jgi:hypothetical protein
MKSNEGKIFSTICALFLTLACGDEGSPSHQTRMDGEQGANAVSQKKASGPNKRTRIPSSKPSLENDDSHQDDSFEAVGAGNNTPATQDSKSRLPSEDPRLLDQALLDELVIGQMKGSDSWQLNASKRTVLK